jgi:hypothetical protein
LLALCALDAWISLAVQVDVLIGSRGLLPVRPLVESFTQVDRAIWLGFPSFLLLDPSDTAIHAGVGLGIALSALALVGVWPRVCLALCAPLYLSYVVAAGDFLAFQWDNLLIESLVLAAFLPRRHESPGTHWMLRLLLFKLYFESGIGKAQSHLGDWWDGSAMTFYYETAPLPAWPAWWAHQLPDLWHTFESWGALGLEGAGAFLILGPRPARLTALFAFTGFQLLNLATANYGFFVYLALALHVFLLDDADLARIARRLPSLRGPRLEAIADRLRRLSLPERRQPVASIGAGVLAMIWLAASLTTAVAHFGARGALADRAAQMMRGVQTYRVANAYHLFGHITRQRIEPEIQTLHAGEWQPRHLRYKPGDLETPPPFVAPHQPRVDFRLWFHGLSLARGVPRYLATLLERVCTDPTAVQSLFAEPLDPEPEAVRVLYWDYRFASAHERLEEGIWWRRTAAGATRSADCNRLR